MVTHSFHNRAQLCTFPCGDFERDLIRCHFGHSSCSSTGSHPDYAQEVARSVERTESSPGTSHTSSSDANPSLSRDPRYIHPANQILPEPELTLLARSTLTDSFYPAHPPNTALSRPILHLLSLPITYLIWPILKFTCRQLVVRPLTTFNSLLDPFKPVLTWLLSAVVLGVGLGLVAALVGEGVGARVPGWQALAGSDHASEQVAPGSTRREGGRGRFERKIAGMGYGNDDEDGDENEESNGKSWSATKRESDDPIDRWRRGTSDASLGLGPDRGVGQQEPGTRSSATASTGHGWMRGSSSRSAAAGGIGDSSSSTARGTASSGGIRYRVPLSSDPVR